MGGIRLFFVPLFNFIEDGTWKACLRLRFLFVPMKVFCRRWKAEKEAKDLATGINFSYTSANSRKPLEKSKF